MISVAVAVNDRDRGMIPLIVSLFTWSKAYHVELVFSDGKSVVAEPKGIHWGDHKFDPYTWVMMPLPQITKEQEIKIREEAESIINAEPKYDWCGAIFGAFMNTSFNQKDRWYCSELVAYLLRGVIPEFIKESQFTPAEVWKVVANRLIQYTESKHVKNHIAAMMDKH